MCRLTKSHSICCNNLTSCHNSHRILCVVVIPGGVTVISILLIVVCFIRFQYSSWQCCNSYMCCNNVIVRTKVLSKALL